MGKKLNPEYREKQAARKRRVLMAAEQRRKWRIENGIPGYLDLETDDPLEAARRDAEIERERQRQRWLKGG